ncbi:unnamed protein product [Prorocentrum cordatum]|uniref:Uncharacterized protein n=1 Tax=Prorocentrum cordatum TaxID=2364126 RepID=A0ABN9XUA4_9DINO|nr:unnamed protein product [Polarella glacialis]
MPAARAGARDDEPSVAAAAEGVGEYRASRFVVRRTLAFCYCGAFLSLAAQAEGLFGCDGPWPAKAGSVLARLPGGLPASAALTAAGLLGGAVSGAAFVAPQALERKSTPQGRSDRRPRSDCCF